jgi:hypothetical protein
MVMKYIMIAVLLILSYFFFFGIGGRKQTKVDDVVKEEVAIKVSTNEKPFLTEEPRWKKLSRIREVSNPDLGVVLGDLESHIVAGHNYNDRNKITWAHQVSHGISAAIRNKVYSKEPLNGFYLLQDRSIVLKEPFITIKDVAREIPEKLQGPSFKLYFVEQNDKWNDKPFYIIDEWVAFTNGSEVGKELNYDGWYFELLQAHNFNVYSIYLAMVTNRDTRNYQDSDLKKFMKWNIERVFRISMPSDREEIDRARQTKIVSNNTSHICPHCRVEGNMEKVDLKRSKEYIELFRTLPEAQNIRDFAKDYFGEEWCKRIYGF